MRVSKRVVSGSSGAGAGAGASDDVLSNIAVSNSDAKEIKKDELTRQRDKLIFLQENYPKLWDSVEKNYSLLKREKWFSTSILCAGFMPVEYFLLAVYFQEGGEFKAGEANDYLKGLVNRLDKGGNEILCEALRANYLKISELFFIQVRYQTCFAFLLEQFPNIDKEGQYSLLRRSSGVTEQYTVSGVTYLTAGDSEVLWQAFRDILALIRSAEEAGWPDHELQSWSLRLRHGIAQLYFYSQSSLQLGAFCRIYSRDHKLKKEGYYKYFFEPGNGMAYTVLRPVEVLFKKDSPRIVSLKACWGKFKSDQELFVCTKDLQDYISTVVSRDSTGSPFLVGLVEAVRKYQEKLGQQEAWDYLSWMAEDDNFLRGVILTIDSPTPDFTFLCDAEEGGGESRLKSRLELLVPAFQGPHPPYCGTIMKKATKMPYAPNGLTVEAIDAAIRSEGDVLPWIVLWMASVLSLRHHGYLFSQLGQDEAERALFSELFIGVDSNFLGLRMLQSLALNDLFSNQNPYSEREVFVPAARFEAATNLVRSLAPQMLSKQLVAIRFFSQLRQNLEPSSELRFELDRFASNAKENDRACVRALGSRPFDDAAKEWVLQILAWHVHKNGVSPIGFLPPDWLDPMGPCSVELKDERGEIVKDREGEGVSVSVTPSYYAVGGYCSTLWGRRSREVEIGLSAADARAFGGSYSLAP